MLAPVSRSLEKDAARRSNAERVQQAADDVGQLLPLVHRTCKATDATSWLEILRTRLFEAKAPCTGRERAGGVPLAAYFFLGAGAYPDGLVAFILDAQSVLSVPSSYTPFDSGSLDKHALPAAPWDDAAKQDFLHEHLGAGADAASFAGAFLAAHFAEPLDYVRRGQMSVPDFPTYHGLQSASGDRRTWTIEVQVHEDVHWGSGGAILNEIVVARPSLLEDLPDDLSRLATVANAEHDVFESIAAAIEDRIALEVS